MVDVANILLFRFLLMRRRDERAEIIIIFLFLGEERVSGNKGGISFPEWGGICLYFQLLRFQEKEGESVCECVCVFLNLEAGRKTDESF